MRLSHTIPETAQEMTSTILNHTCNQKTQSNRKCYCRDFIVRGEKERRIFMSEVGEKEKKMSAYSTNNIDYDYKEKRFMTEGIRLCVYT